MANRQTVEKKPGRGRDPASLANLTGGSRKGVPNKTTALLKDALLEAARLAGGREGLVGYLTAQAQRNPAAFLALLGKVLPLQLAGEGNDGAIMHEIRIVGVAP